MREAIDAKIRRHGAKPPGTIAGYTRLIIGSLRRGHADAVKTFEQLSGRMLKRLLIVGGGSRNRLLCQATADACRLPVVSYSLEGSAIGNLASQLIALGTVRDIAEFRCHLARQLNARTYSPSG
jgi:rhamnulokinase